MPAYEYQCQSCGSRFERRQKMSDAAIDACPQCGGAVKRLISGGAGVISRGSAGASCVPAACGADGACPAPEMGCGGMCGCGN